MNEIARGTEDADREYFQAVEAEFIARRGTPFLLSPKDFGVVRRWRSAGVPLSDVLFGIEEAFRLRAERQTAGRINSLAYCEGSVLEAWERRSSARLGAPDESTEKRGDPGKILDSLFLSLEGAAGREEALRPAFDRASESLRRLRDSGRSEEEMEESLSRIEKKLLRDVEDRLAAEERELIEVGIAQLLRVDARTMESSALKKTARVLFRKRLRERYGLPRLTLLA